MRALHLVLLALAILFVAAGPALAQQAVPTTEVFGGSGVGGGIGAAITIVGAGYGFGRIGAAALESMARQPEAAGRIQTAMIVIAALLEGATFFALIICIIISGSAKW
jgi:F-type H+-transporting ATPase subunit c